METSLSNVELREHVITRTGEAGPVYTAGRNVKRYSPQKVKLLTYSLQKQVPEVILTCATG